MATGLLSAAAAWLWSGPSRWHAHLDALVTFTAHRFESVWDDPPARSLLAQTMADDLEVGVRVFDLEQAVLESYGPSCYRPYDLEVTAHGHVELCLHHWSNPNHSPILIPFLVGGFVLWMASGAIAYRLTRPLAQLVAVTQALGEGDLEARMRGRLYGGEIHAIAHAVNEMADRIQAMIGTERELLASVSHEIRTPLGHLRVLLDTARERETDPRLLEEIEREIVTIDTLVGQLLAHSRLEFRNLERRTLDAVDLAVRALERADVEPTVLEADAEHMPLRADPGLVLQALANLVRNAQEHGDGITRLRVTTRAHGVAFEVEDAGAGFADGDTERAFERGYQGGDGHGSLGLGLALVRRIAEAHGGSATAENLDSGARVSVVFPPS